MSHTLSPREELINRMRTNAYFMRISYFFMAMLSLCLIYLFMASSNWTLILLVLSQPPLFYYFNIRRLNKERDQIEKALHEASLTH
ncbi:hypothetical protein FUAX_11990 [Fulvitalea axinellae]|uniref:DUF4229 domain-containing protein n=1 Tax=Fulvitalea axinellae TaxID=1182444 RepID=A0AAU9CTM0_9BACT|nr:hypothetical protein FUAX_11990 [Fulvitalea axinellae]